MNWIQQDRPPPTCGLYRAKRDGKVSCEMPEYHSPEWQHGGRDASGSWHFWRTDLFPEPKPRGSAQCPKCGKFSKIIRVVNEGAPLTAEFPTYVAIVYCKQHGEGIA